MRRPKFIGLFVLCLSVAAVLGLLAQWQWSRAVEQPIDESIDTEAAVPLTTLATPGGPMRQEAIGRIVTVEGEWVPVDTFVIDDRQNGAEHGHWVVTRLETTAAGERAGASAKRAALMVVRGFSPSRDDAERVRAELQASSPAAATLTGRYEFSQAPDTGAAVHAGDRMTRMSVAELVGRFRDYDALAYTGFVVDRATAPGLTPVISPKPNTDATLNALNIFYAIEWITFAFFAFWVWWRLVRDEHDREREAAEYARSEGVRERARQILAEREAQRAAAASSDDGATPLR